MKSLRYVSLSLVLGTSFAAHAQLSEDHNFRKDVAVVYAQGVHGPLLADAYVPNGKGPFPGVLFIHGGGWKTGDRNQMNKLIRDTTNAGFSSFTIEYDMDPVLFPHSLNESLAALEYFRSHAKEFKLDPTRIAVAGSSAGGELAALVALSPQPRAVDGQPAGAPIAPVQAAVILNGVLDLRALGDKSGMVTEYLGGHCTEKPEACKDASPVEHVHAGAPPFYVGHGTADQTVPYSQAEAFTAALYAAKVPVQFYGAQNGPHTYWMRPEFYAGNTTSILQFLQTALKSTTK
ncbi:alpha/beta hydrolase fold domain-containing protein [Granulicella cerasi]|uniref:Alpha/beta hydrolase fold domain-containing protein n=1 Tax=Granulicella cerasi TaxID=741063 RepID=A0ABW1Z4T2_9BACT|nr:alpha/beta hydrolase [Granulicella cerasi]